MTPFRDSDRDCNLESENVAASGRPEIVAVTGALENIMTAMAHWYLSLSRMQWQDQTRGTTPDSSALGTPFPRHGNGLILGIRHDCLPDGRAQFMSSRRIHDASF